MPALVLVLLMAAIALLLAAAFGVTHQRVQLVPLALALALMVPLAARLWPP
jgi:hypothetical protein